MPTIVPQSWRDVVQPCWKHVAKFGAVIPTNDPKMATCQGNQSNLGEHYQHPSASLHVVEPLHRFYLGLALLQILQSFLAFMTSQMQTVWLHTSSESIMLPVAAVTLLVIVAKPPHDGGMYSSWKLLIQYWRSVKVAFNDYSSNWCTFPRESCLPIMLGSPLNSLSSAWLLSLIVYPTNSIE